MIELRPYQTAMIEQTRQHFRERRKRVLLQLATGGGKTALASRMLHGAADKGKRVWFCCHRRELVKQISEAFDREGLGYGYIAAGQPMELSKQAQICSIPTLAKRWQKAERPDVIVVDECHHAASKSWSDLLKQFPDAYIVGLSATPCRLDGKGLKEYFDVMVQGPSVVELIEQGYLCDYRLFAPGGVSRERLRKSMGDFNATDVNSLMSNPVIVGNAIEHYRKHTPNTQTIIFAASIERSKDVAKKFTDSGIPALHMDGTLDDHVRDEMVRDYKRGLIRVLSNVELFSEGFDLPSIETGILMRPTMSLAMHKQQMGRVMRPSPGKKFGNFIDMVGNTDFLGWPDDDIQWTLTDGVVKEKKDTVGSPRICSYCFSSSRAGSRICRNCKQPFPVESRQVDEMDGELVEMDKASRKQRAPRTPEQRRQHWEKVKDQVKANSLESLIELGIKKYGEGKGERWARYVFNGRQKKRGVAA